MTHRVVHTSGKPVRLPMPAASLRYRLLAIVMWVVAFWAPLTPIESLSGELLPGLDTRPVSQTCVAPERPSQEASNEVQVDIVRVFPNLEFDQPISMLQAPNDNSKWYMAERNGIVWVFDNRDDVATKSVSLDIEAKLAVTSDAASQQGGITSFAFHPRFPEMPYLYVSYNARPDRQSPVVSVVSRFETSDAGNTFAADSETIILSQVQDIVIAEFEDVSRFHHLGQIAFGNDGYLYIGFGDPNGSQAQDLSNWHGSILRIDVDGGEPYAIPPDNPFVGLGDAKAEIYAYGLRNPWRFSFDRETGNLWVGDAGGSEWEEVDIVVKGGNYGWKIMEGNHCVEPGCDPTGLMPPVIEYSHDVGSVVIGGFVYRGRAIPTLVGSYVVADGSARDLWRVFFDDNGNPQLQTISQSSDAKPHFFAQDHDGELYFSRSRPSPQWVRKIVPKASRPLDVPPFPTLLSQTGCVDPANPRFSASGTIPYDVNSPLWSDGAAKQRWMAIPDGSQIVAQIDGDFELPIGTVLVQQFSFDDIPVETRLFVRHSDGGWTGYSYEWLDDGTDAVLLETEKTKTLFNGQEWSFPSRAQCLSCHTEEARYALGLELVQFNRQLTYPSTGRTANQLTTLQHIGVLLDPQGRLPDQLPALAAAGDVTRSFEDRSRSYLHANCSNCHRPDGPTPALIDFRFLTAESSMNVCNVAPQLGALGIESAFLIAPGEPERSIVFNRMGRRDEYQMPPHSTFLVDAVALEVIGNWILSEDICQPSDRINRTKRN